VGPRRELERFKSRVPDQNQIRTSFVRIEANLLQFPPVKLEVGREVRRWQFGLHEHVNISQRRFFGGLANHAEINANCNRSRHT
jgi:hypothetical protein